MYFFIAKLKKNMDYVFVKLIDIAAFSAYLRAGYKAERKKYYVKIFLEDDFDSKKITKIRYVHIVRSIDRISNLINENIIDKSDREKFIDSVILIIRARAIPNSHLNMNHLYSVCKMIEEVLFIDDSDFDLLYEHDKRIFSISLN
jgi:hypothetical protein